MAARDRDPAAPPSQSDHLDEDADPPADEGDVKQGGRDADATARGKPVDPKDTRYNEVVRNVGKLRESVSVHYNKALEPANLPDSKPK